MSEAVDDSLERTRDERQIALKAYERSTREWMRTYIVYVDKPGQSEWATIGGGIGAYNEEQAGDDSSKSLCFALRAPDEGIVGGLIGATHCDQLYVDLMWVKSELRGCGYGHRLLTLAEDEARKRGAKMPIWTPPASRRQTSTSNKHRCQVFGELQDFPPGYQRYFLTTQL
ncbi:MAG: GNAT family N-acetyltransferase [Anaerolineae bacterium]|nr:GNAT family N-acetyltransferase [Anaerolineae bacterium]